MEKNKKYFITLLCFALLINIYQGYNNYRTKKVIRAKNEIIAFKDKKLVKAKATIDKAIEELNSSKKEIARLGGDTTFLSEKIREIIKKRNDFLWQSKEDREKYLSLLEEIKQLKNEFQLKNRKKDFPDSFVKAENDSLKKEIENLSLLLKGKKDTLVFLERQNSFLKSKLVARGSLTALDIKTFVINLKGRAKEKNIIKQGTQKIRVEFTIHGNSHSETGSRSLVLFINPPAGSGHNNIISHTRIDFKGKAQKIHFDISFTHPLSSGLYGIIIKSEENIAGDSKFIVR